MEHDCVQFPKPLLCSLAWKHSYWRKRCSWSWFVTENGRKQFLKALVWGRQEFAQSVKCWESKSLFKERVRWEQLSRGISPHHWFCSPVPGLVTEIQGWPQSQGVTPSCGGNLSWSGQVPEFKHQQHCCTWDLPESWLGSWGWCPRPAGPGTSVEELVHTCPSRAAGQPELGLRQGPTIPKAKGQKGARTCPSQWQA